ncbi:MAG: hypothetical protein Q9168_000840 [Polycauliona sp. 1 TL-2023]
MDDIPPSYEAATQRDYWTIIADYVLSSDDLCAASRVCKKWHQIYTPLLWGNPASHFGIENDRAYAQAELYGGPRTAWLRDVLVKLPNLQSLLVSQLPFFDHASLHALRIHNDAALADGESGHVFPLRLLIAAQCTNTTHKSLASALFAFPHLVSLDLSRTLGARHATVLSTLQHMTGLQILKLCGIQLRDEDLGVLADSIGIRVRSLDVRNNLLTDNAARTLLQACFSIADNSNEASSRRQGGLSGAVEEVWYSGVLKPNPAVLDEFRDESFDNRYLRRLTHGLVSRMPSEDQAPAGITHLYISDNHLTVEGLSGLLRSGRLHVLDAGSVDIARVHNRTTGLSGAEKLTPILAKYASKNLTSLRFDHSVVSRSTMIKEGKPKSESCELSSDTGLQELPISSPRYAPPEYSQEHFELAGHSVHDTLPPSPVPSTASQGQYLPQTERNGTTSSRTLENQTDSIDEGEDAPVPTITGLGSVEQSASGIFGPTNSNIEDSLDTTARTTANIRSSSPQISLSNIAKRRQDLQHRQASRPHGLLPSMLPQLRSLTLTSVPCYDVSGQVIDALVEFIGFCASEAELATLQVDLESTYRPRPLRQTPETIFALRKITLEMCPPDLSSRSVAPPPGSPQPSRSPNHTFRTKSSTEDADSEAFWAAQEKDFSFFDNGDVDDDDEERGSPSVKPGSRISSSTVLEKTIVSGDDETALPTSQQQQQQQQHRQQTTTTSPAGKDVIQELVRFRKDRKAAFEDALKRGERMVEGYWPGEVRVARWQGGGKTGMMDYSGNQCEKGYNYR